MNRQLSKTKSFYTVICGVSILCDSALTRFENVTRFNRKTSPLDRGPGVMTHSPSALERLLEHWIIGEEQEEEDVGALGWVRGG